MTREPWDMHRVLHYLWLGCLGGGLAMSLQHLGVPWPAIAFVCVGLGGSVESTIQRIRR